MDLEYLKVVTGRANLVGDIDDDVLNKLKIRIQETYEADKTSMSDWFNKMKRGLELASLVKDDKTYPHDRAANVKFPLLTQAAMQYNARVYPAIVPSGDPIKAKVHGEDPDGAKASRQARVTEYGSYHLREVMENWEEDMDRLTFIGPIVGTMFKKVWYEPSLDAPRSKLCRAGSVIVNHNITHLRDAPAITEELFYRPHEIETKIRSGLWEDVREKIDDADDPTASIEFLEQHLRFDLDEDGYDEPYVVMIHADSGAICRVVANFTMQDVQMAGDEVLSTTPRSYFVPYTFMPSFDGGFHGDGLGMLLGDTSETINTTINMLLDAAHYSATPAGFVGGRDLRIKPGIMRLRPGEWRTLAQKGDDIRKGMVQLDMPEPSPVLFQLLGLLVEMGKDIASAKDISPDQARQMTATTTMALVDQGERVFSVSYKRIYRALCKEYRLLFDALRMTNEEKYAEFFDTPADLQADFNPDDMAISPVADPKAVTNTQKAAKAQFLYEAAQTGMISPQEAMSRVLEAMNIEDIDELVVPPDPRAQAINEMQFLDAQLGLRMKAAEIDHKIAETTKAMAQAEAEDGSVDIRQYMETLEAMKKEIEIERGRFDNLAVRPNHPIADQGAAQARI